MKSNSFTQVMGIVPRQLFQRLVKKYNGDYRVREFNCTNQLRDTLFGQLISCESLRDICLCLNASSEILYGFGIAVNESTMPRTNEKRDCLIYEGLGVALMKIVQPLYSKTKIDNIVPQDYELLVLDSTTISCSVNLMVWALGKYSKDAVKMHTPIDLRGSTHVFIHITDNRCHDSNILDILEIVTNAIYTMDKAYVDFETLFRIDSAKAFFVTRAKDNIKHETLSSNFNIDPKTGLVGDHVIRLTGTKSGKLYPKELRLVEYHDIESGDTIRFITNIMDCGNSTGWR